MFIDAHNFPLITLFCTW